LLGSGSRPVTPGKYAKGRISRGGYDGTAVCRL
jgi:hypothetical protein